MQQRLTRNGSFKKTKSMSALLEERAKRQKVRLDAQPRRKKAGDDAQPNHSLQNLVESVKRKSAAAGAAGVGKRRKL